MNQSEVTQEIADRIEQLQRNGYDRPYDLALAALTAIRKAGLKIVRDPHANRLR